MEDGGEYVKGVGLGGGERLWEEFVKIFFVVDDPLAGACHSSYELP